MQRVSAFVRGSQGKVWTLVYKSDRDGVGISYIARTDEEEILLHNTWASQAMLTAVIEAGRVLAVEPL